MRFQNYVSIVTGGAHGIGRAIARRFAAEGSSVVIADIDSAAGLEATKEINNLGGIGKFIHTNVANRKDVQSLMNSIINEHNRIDVLINNAGIAHGPKVTAHFIDISEEDWNEIIGIHLNGLFYCSQLAARIMVKQNNGGCIVNISSVGATKAHRSRVAYDRTKGGIEAATRAMALDLAPLRIRVNAIAPGPINVPNRTLVGKEGQITASDVIPLARIGTSDEVAAAAVFLASDEAAFITGTTLFVDGGFTIQLRPPMLDEAI